MRSKTGSIRTQNIVTHWAVGTLLGLIGFPSLEVSAQEPLEPSWRLGVSRWTGSGYQLPPIVSTTTSTTGASQPVISEAPYTIPVDPSHLPAPSGVGISGSSPQSNPYFTIPTVASPPVDPATSLELTSPSDIPAGTKPFAPLAPLAPTVSDQDVTLPLVDQQPLERKELGTETLPPPATVAAPIDIDDSLGEPATASEEAPIVDPESIADQIEGEAGIETAPLESEVIRWYQYPRRWIRGWNSHAEFGLDGSTGNARTLAIQTGLEMKRKTDLDTWALDIDYRQASNRSVTTEDNGRLNIDYDRLLMDTPWSGFGKFGMEWDKFKAFDLRLNLNGGVGYHWIRRDDATLVTRFGAGASKEIGAPDDAWIPEAVFGAEAERQLTSRQKLKGKIDYFPAWEDFGNYRLVSDVAWEILLDGIDNLSLRLAATDRYDSTPQGAKKNDLYYSMLLLYKF